VSGRGQGDDFTGGFDAVPGPPAGSRGSDRPAEPGGGPSDADYDDGRLSRVAAVGAALLVTFLWSSSWVLIRWGLDDEALEPVTFAALRYGMAAMLLVAWAASRERHRLGWRRLDRSARMQVVALGVVFYAVTQGAQFVAIDNQPAATTSLVLSLTPLLVAVLAGVSLGEHPLRRQVLGTVLVAAGAWLYFAGFPGATGIGMAAAVVALAANVVSALLGRRINRPGDVSPVVVTAISMAVGAAILMAAGLVVEGSPAVSARAWLIIGWLATVNTAWAFTLWNLSLRRLTAVESAGINNTMLIQIALLAWLFLDERLGAVEWAGIGLVSIGVLLAQLSTATRRGVTITNPGRTT
jgi:drug/metabolite transporter (DMT)-like permease